MLLSSSTIRRLAWLLVGVLGGLAMVLVLPERTPPSVVPVVAPAEDAAAAELRPAALAPVDTAVAPSMSAAIPLNAAERALQLDDDLHALALALLPLATAGDAESQYSLALIVRECHFELKRHADRAELDAFLETVPRRTGIDPVEYATLQRRRFEACDGFRADPIEAYGTDAELFTRAAAAGQPLAALELELRAPLRGAPRDATALNDAARAALASRRPEAFLLLLELEFPDEDGPEARDATPNAVAWWLLACQRGYPCGPEARWRREQIAFRGGQRADLDWDDALLFDLPAHEREQARERAVELGRALDAGEVETILPQVR